MIMGLLGNLVVGFQLLWASWPVAHRKTLNDESLTDFFMGRPVTLSPKPVHTEPQ